MGEKAYYMLCSVGTKYLINANHWCYFIALFLKSLHSAVGLKLAFFPTY